jgi:hypothetical protein
VAGTGYSLGNSEIDAYQVEEKRPRRNFCKREAQKAIFSVASGEAAL